MSEPDRISYAYGMKLSIGNYESADFHISLSSDVKKGETQEQALERIKEFVEDEVGRKIDETRSIFGRTSK